MTSVDGMYPSYPDIPKYRPWFSTYKRYGIATSINMPSNDSSLIDILEQNFERYADRQAYLCMGGSITYQELDHKSRQIAAYLQSLGLSLGDKVAVMLPNLLQYPIIMVAIIRAGFVLVNMNPMYTSHELEQQLNSSGAKAIFVIETVAKTLQDVKDKTNIEHIVICRIDDMLGVIQGTIANVSMRYLRYNRYKVPSYSLPDSIGFKQALTAVPIEHYQRPKLSLEGVALLQYTGGTTGVAKGAMLTHGNLIANMLQIDMVIKAAFKDACDTNDMILTALPLYHVFSFMICGIYSMYVGFTGLLIPNTRDINSLVKQIDKYQPAYIPAVNTLFNALLNHKRFARLDFSHLKLALGGGTSVMPSVAKRWHTITGLPIIEGYGMTETSPLVSFNPLTVSKFTAKIGIPTPSTDVILIDDKGRIVPIGERGEICVKGPQVMAGYHNQPDETANSFTKDGYLKSGDVGIMDASGYLKIVDRKKDMILVSGFNVYPNEIEAAISEHPAVLECGAIGVPSEERGEEPKIFVVKKYEVTAEELLEFSKTQLTGYKRPRQIQFIDEMPKSAVGKVLRKDLRKREGLE